MIATGSTGVATKKNTMTTPMKANKAKNKDCNY